MAVSFSQMLGLGGNGRPAPDSTSSPFTNERLVRLHAPWRRTAGGELAAVRAAEIHQLVDAAAHRSD
jgi:hypothetical protein